MARTPMEIISVKMPKAYVDALDELVFEGKFSSRSEAIRTAVREFLQKEFWRRKMQEYENRY